jgi:hypothetical protein
MARDLIPPPSPAGRASADGTPNLVELPPEAPPVVTAATAPSAPSEFRHRFGFLLGGLGGVVIAAAAVAAIVISTGGRPDEGFAKNWSKWRPLETTMTAGPAEIATHVGAQYRGDDGKQLVAVSGGPLEVQGIPLDVALRPGQGDIRLFNGHHAVRYVLNGLGPQGSIIGGTVSKSRHQLLRREALELALYSFRYLPDVDMVVTLLPPPPPKDGATATQSGTASNPYQAVFYRPGDLKPQLQVPLGVTVPKSAPKPQRMGGAEGQRVDSLTLSNLFQAFYTQSQDLKAYMVLDRPK